MKMPKVPPNWLEYMGAAMTSPETSQAFFQKVVRQDVQNFVRRANDSYLHWDKLRHVAMPDGIDVNEIWAAVGMSRQSQYRHIELSSEPGAQFKFWLPPSHQQWLHRIDQNAGGALGSSTKLISRSSERFLFNSLMEEAIASSQLEGASTTRTVAKQMLRTKRKPRDRHEQMIVNNYHAILEIRDRLENELTPDFLCHIHQVITEKTLDNPEAAGRFRTEEDGETVVEDGYTQDVLYRAPKPSSFDWRIQELCDFANEQSKPFIHPVVKAIVLHFALGFIHPFVDGNGRVARSIFYWYMLRSGYWIFEYLPISRIVLDSPAKYGRAYLYSETDAGDLGYFIHYNLRVIDLAVREMHEYFARQQELMQKAKELLDGLELNHRQMAVANNAIQDANLRITFSDHAGTFGVARGTARNDLIALEEKGILQRCGKSITTTFMPAPHLSRRLQGGAFRKLPNKKAERSKVAQTATKQVPKPTARQIQLPVVYPNPTLES